MKTVDVIAEILLVIGGLKWGLVGLFEFDLVAALFGGVTTAAAKTVYILVGIAALYQVFALKAIRRRWAELPARRHGASPG